METTVPHEPSTQRTVIKWVLVAVAFAITAGTVVYPLVLVPDFKVFLTAGIVTVLAGVGVWISVPSPPRVAFATVVRSIVFVVAAVGVYANLDAATRAFELRSDRAATANVLSRYATVTIGAYSTDGLPVTIHNRALTAEYMKVAIEARGPDGIVIASERQGPVVGARGTLRTMFFKPGKRRTDPHDDPAFDVRDKYMRAATFTIVFADTEAYSSRRTSR
ncbi:hypothetical protein ACQ7HM_14265 [Williamsia sp. MIQD14]|uniref:hypothetical protein n=1 Tax=Williamsia sp. MIQD14 TaxID=3425703 RepID=UPI003D9FDF2C